MYEEYFGFDRRPFPTHGAAPVFIRTPVTEDALTQLERCTREGRGIGILSAPAGTGKTAVALEVARRISDRLKVVYLSSSNFTSRRGMLQAILFELGLDYAGLSEQEARLQIIEYARRLLPEQDGLALLVDEADQLSERLLEELRGLANYIHEGRPLVRVVLIGQLELDERLASRELEAFNQRVGCHAVLEPLDRKQSADYIRETLASCGRQPEEVFEVPALDLICAASDGNVRCLHHLCDHSLLLSFVAEATPVSEATVRGALDDLQGLPLNWNVPAAARPAQNTDFAEETDPIRESLSEPAERPEEAWESPRQPESPPQFVRENEEPAPVRDMADTTVIEFGGDESSDETSAGKPTGRCELPRTEPMIIPPTQSDSREYRLQDPYADLDRSAERESQQTTWRSSVLESLSCDSPAEVTRAPRPIEIPPPDDAAQRSLESRLLAEIADMREEVQQVSSISDSIHELRSSTIDDARTTDDVSDEVEWDVVLPESEDRTERNVLESIREEEPAAPPPVEAATLNDEFNEGIEPVVSLQPRPVVDSDEGQRRYAFLFTRLRNRRRELARLDEADI